MKTNTFIFKFTKIFKQAGFSQWPFILLMVMGMQLSMVSGLQAAQRNQNQPVASRQITDPGITTAVEENLIREQGVFANDLNVSTHQGIVTLSGSVGNILARDRAVKVAESVRGVKGVINQVQVAPVSRPDENIRQDILSALLQDPATTSYQISVSVKNGVVTLDGIVGSYQEKRLAQRIAEGVKGVRDVHNNVLINYHAHHTDSAIAATIQSRLKWDIWINGGKVDVSVKNGNVTLTGTVGSALSKTRAYDDAWVDGVKSVDNSGVKVDPWMRNASQRKFKHTTRSDQQIKRAVEAAFHLDPRVAPFSPNVTVEDGTVILGGTVGNMKAKHSADEDAKNIVGVWQVDNLLNIRPNKQPADQTMGKQLKAAITWDPLLDSANIKVAVINRVAYLSGTVDTQLQKREASDVASKIKGIVLVRNHLKVNSSFESFSYSEPFYYDWPDYPFYDVPYYNQPSTMYSGKYRVQSYLSDKQIKKNIEDAFFWSPFVNGKNIHVKVQAGVVTLTGKVGSWIGYGQAYQDAQSSGAVVIRDRLQVK